MVYWVVGPRAMNRIQLYIIDPIADGINGSSHNIFSTSAPLSLGMAGAAMLLALGSWRKAKLA